MDFKEHFNIALMEELAVRTSVVYSNFNRERYLNSIPSDWLSLEMKSRVCVLSNALWQGLGVEFAQASPILCALLDPIESKGLPAMAGMPVWVISQIVEDQGLGAFDEAMSVIHQLTQQFTGEFAIRSFLRQYPEKTFAVLRSWTKDASPHVRRLASEGCRPRLPWGTQIPHLRKDPLPILAVLELLVMDSSEYVRRSVANNMNDIAKDYPELVLQTMRAWKLRAPNHPEVDGIIRHGLRGLARQGHLETLEFLGYPSETFLSDVLFSVTPTIKLGEAVHLSCQFQVEQPLNGLMIDYMLLSPGKSGRMNKKVFKWSKRQLIEVGEVHLERDHLIMNRRSRTYYPGDYTIALIINGRVVAQSHFLVIE